MLTPEQLDAIATQLMGWKRNPNEGGMVELCGRSYEYAAPWLDKDGEPRAFSEDNPASAMLVLKAMGERFDTTLVLGPKANTCFVDIPHGSMRGNVGVLRGDGDTPEAAIFQCAAKLVERMDER